MVFQPPQKKKILDPPLTEDKSFLNQALATKDAWIHFKPSLQSLSDSSVKMLMHIHKKSVLDNIHGVVYTEFTELWFLTV